MVRTRFGIVVATALAGCAVEGSGGNSSTPPVPPEPDVLADLRADSNRDGEIKFDDSDVNKTEWNKSNGAVFLANIDDDSERCKITKDDDFVIAACNDAEDEIINGDDDALDLARMKTRPWPKTPADATGHVTVADSAKAYVRLFKKVGEGAADFEVLSEDNAFSSEELKAGVELAIEGKDIVRDATKWDGYVDVELKVSSAKGEATDKVRLRVAPVLTFHHLLPAEKVWVSNTGNVGNKETRQDLATACTAAELPAPETLNEPDPWTQDFFEPAYMSMPGPGGTQHVVHLNYRSANIYQPEKKKAPLREAGKLVFELRGKDIAGIQQFDPKHDLDMDTLNSFGNFETIPPHEKDGVAYPLGRVLRGSAKSFFPDESFNTMIQSQGQQPSIYIDTSWLLVAHVDETLSFVKAPTPRGWVLLANDARLAKKMLEDAVAAGHGDVPMFVGKSWYDYETGTETPAQITISEVLADKEVMQASAEAATEVDAQVAKIKAEVGLSDDEIVPIPFLHITTSGRSVAYQPGTVNGIYLSDTRFASPDPHGPLIDGKDIFKTAIAEPLGKLGITVDFVEDWDGYHVNLGEVHCGTNTTRKIPEARWWESGR